MPDGTGEVASLARTRRGDLSRPGSVRASIARRVTGRRISLPLAVLLVLALAQGLVWSVMTAPFNGPDEPAHIAYAQLLAETGQAPTTASKAGAVSTEVARAEYELNLAPIFGAPDARPTWSAYPKVAHALDHIPTAQRRNGTGPNAVAHNPPLYYAYVALAYKLSPDGSILGRVFAMRVATVLLYVATVGLMWLLAGELFARQWVRFLATALVALQPKLAALAANVNPDTLLVMLSTAFLLAGVRLLRRGPTVVGAGWVAFLAGLAAMTHGRGLFLIPPAIVVIVLAWLRAKPGLRQVALQGATAAALVIGCFAVAFLWTRGDTAGGGAFGGEVGRAATTTFNPRQFVSYVWQFYFPRFGFLTPSLGPPYGYRQMFIDTFFGGYANYELNFRPVVYDWLQIFSFLGILALYGCLVRRWRWVHAHWPVILFLVATLFSLLALLHISSYRDMQVGGDPLITGRYLLPCVSIAAITVAFVIGSLPRRIAPWVAGLALGGFVLLNVEALLITMQRFYA